MVVDFNSLRFPVQVNEYEGRLEETHPFGPYQGKAISIYKAGSSSAPVYQVHIGVPDALLSDIAQDAQWLQERDECLHVAAQAAAQQYLLGKPESLHRYPSSRMIRQHINLSCPGSETEWQDLQPVSGCHRCVT